VINTGPLTFVLHELLYMCSCPSRQNVLVCVRSPCWQRGNGR